MGKFVFKHEVNVLDLPQSIQIRMVRMGIMKNKK